MVIRFVLVIAERATAIQERRPFCFQNCMAWALLASTLPPTEHLCVHLKWEKRCSEGEGRASISEGRGITPPVSDCPGPPAYPPTVHSMAPAGKPRFSMERMAPVLQLPLTHSHPVPPVIMSTGVCDPYLDPASSLKLAFGLKLPGLQTPNLCLLDTHGANEGNFFYTSSL